MVQTAPKSPSKISEIPVIDKNAPLKIEEIEETQLTEKIDTRLLIIGIIISVIIILATTGVFVIKIIQPAKEEVNTPAIEVEETQEEVKAFDRTSWTVEVLNGSGVVGAASKAAKQIESLGYIVFKTGNADSSDYETTEVYILSSLIDNKADFMADINKEFPTASYSGELTDSSASARIILGKK